MADKKTMIIKMYFFKTNFKNIQDDDSLYGINKNLYRKYTEA